MENVNSFTHVDFLIQKFTQKRVICVKMKIVTKQQIIQIIPIVLASLPSFIYGIQKKSVYDHLTPFFTKKQLPLPT